jgi:SAM-dependent methyltransferase
MAEFTYAGSELDLFAAVHNWKAYWTSQVQPFLHGDVLEVGAGIGSNTLLLNQGSAAHRWVCVEPDPQLIGELQRKLHNDPNGQLYEAITGTLANVAGQLFDTVIYIDVLEHIEHDGEELTAAAKLLRPGGHIIVLSPAHQSLYTPFDAAIGHFRRYNKKMVRAISPPSLKLIRLRYLDFVGLSASSANRLMLRQSMPTAAQLHVWDKWMIPVSRVVDTLLGYSMGKSIIAIWQKPPLTSPE